MITTTKHDPATDEPVSAVTTRSRSLAVDVREVFDLAEEILGSWHHLEAEAMRKTLKEIKRDVLALIGGVTTKTAGKYSRRLKETKRVTKRRAIRKP